MQVANGRALAAARLGQRLLVGRAHARRNAAAARRRVVQLCGRAQPSTPHHERGRPVRLAVERAEAAALRVPAVGVQHAHLAAHACHAVMRGQQQLVTQRRRLRRVASPRCAGRAWPRVPRPRRLAGHALRECDGGMGRQQVEERGRQQRRPHRLAVAAPSHARIVGPHHVPSQEYVLPALGEAGEVGVGVEKIKGWRGEHRVHVRVQHLYARLQHLRKRRPFERQQTAARARARARSSRRCEQQHRSGGGRARGGVCGGVHGEDERGEAEGGGRLREGLELRLLTPGGACHHQLVSPQARPARRFGRVLACERVAQRLADWRVAQAARRATLRRGRHWVEQLALLGRGRRIASRARGTEPHGQRSLRDGAGSLPGR